MRQLFDEVLQIQGVLGALIFDERGRILHREFRKGDPGNPESTPWWASFIDTLKGISVLELVCDGGRAYIRRAPEGFLLILMDDNAPMAMIRLSCDVLLHRFEHTAGKRKAKGLFGRWR